MKQLEPNYKGNWINIFAHISHGFIAGFFWWVSWPLSIFMFVQFLLYEFVEESKVRDEMYREIKEWATGFVVGVLFSWFWGIDLLLLTAHTANGNYGGGGGGFEKPRLA